MAISQDRAVADIGLYVPFRGIDREVGFCGTLFLDASATGDASGGAIQIRILMSKFEFGFHPIFVPTRVSAFDNATAEVVVFQYGAVGNERISDTTREPKLGVAGFGGNSMTFESLGIPIEPILEGGGDVMGMQWLTNVDTKLYHAHIFGVIYDAEAMARGKVRGRKLDVLLGGVR